MKKRRRKNQGIIQRKCYRFLNVMKRPESRSAQNVTKKRTIDVCSVHQAGQERSTRR